MAKLAQFKRKHLELSHRILEVIYYLFLPGFSYKSHLIWVSQLGFKEKITLKDWSFTGLLLSSDLWYLVISKFR